MRILVVGDSFDSAGLASRLAFEGNSVWLFCNEKSRSGEGFISTVETEIPLVLRNASGSYEVSEETLRTLVEVNPQLVILDSWVFGCVPKEVWDCPVVGTDIHVIPTQISKETNEKVIRTCGIPSAGPNVTLVAPFDGMDFVDPAYLVFIQTAFMAGDLGLDVPCSCFSALRVERETKIFQTFVSTLREFLSGDKCFVEVSLNPTRFSVRLTPLVASIYSEVITTNLSDFLFKLANSSVPADVPHRGEWVCGSLISIPPYPVLLEPPKSRQLRGLIRQNRRHFWILGLRKDDEGNVFTTENPGVLGLVTAYGSNLEMARLRVSRTLRSLSAAYMQYRTDIGFQVRKSLEILSGGGWLTPAEKGKDDDGGKQMASVGQEEIGLDWFGDDSSSDGECVDGAESE